MGDIFEEILPGVWRAGQQENPPLVLLHGWGGTGPSNFGFAVETLSRHWELTAIDLAGHGHGTRLNKSDVSVEDLTDDATEKMVLLGISSAIIVGYSLGGAVAQTLWHNFPSHVKGLVLGGTATRLSPTPIANFALHAWASTNALTGPAWGALGAGARAVLRLGANRGVDVTNMSGVADHNGTAIQLLAKGVANFNSGDWIDDVDVPVGVLVCLDDRLVPTRRQYRLAERTKAVSTVSVPGGHLGFLRNPQVFASALEEVAAVVSHVADLKQKPARN